jgi:hypothetical protein
MLKHEWYFLVVLKYALALGRRDELGRPTTWGVLSNVIREAGLDADGLLDALMRLDESRVMVLKKTHQDSGRFLTFEYAEFSNKNQFFWGEFALYVTPKGIAYFNELVAKVCAAIPLARTLPPQRPQIGFSP